MPNPGKPSRLKAVSGSQTAAVRRSQGGLDAALPEDPPDVLDGVAAEEWRRVVGYVSRWPGWLETADRGLLVAYCAWWSAFVEASGDVSARGVLVPGRSSADEARGDAGLVKNRSVSIMSDATTNMRLLAAALGLDAWHRQRLDRLEETRWTRADELLS